MPDTDHYKSILIARKAELQGRLRQIETDLDEPTSADSEERAVELEDDEVLESMGQAGLAELRAVEAALGRIEKGTFGTCARCGGPIAEARLKLVPHAAICEQCIRAQ
ncbi:TraR/DksA family transcriptional regulator [Rhizobium alvei]|uniref:TraR/DksA C4-type zinc finger protein n=1 Tax=Rhizobium alvei TaxID=1132659 RepID=A0ABT8YH23_9HYPH|nr:TraR/DksA C4-type zinc finger protein [Rhizobium alvei]MDO6962707.1 TraR/DksA C4-type zinc finger protein [Rhizobium alvei]